MLVDIEYSSRKNNRLKRLIRNAGFDQPEASIMDINYTSGRKLNKELINRLATCYLLIDLEIARTGGFLSAGLAVLPHENIHFSKIPGKSLSKTTNTRKFSSGSIILWKQKGSDFLPAPRDLAKRLPFVTLQHP